MPSNHNATAFPVFALLLGATMWGVIWYPLRLLSDAGLGGLWASLVMYASASLIGLTVAWRYLHEWRRRPWLLVFIGLANGWTNVAFILAVIDGHVVRVLLLFYLSPLWTVLLGWLVLGERPARMSVIALTLAFSGALLMLWDPDIGWPWPAGRADWLALSAGLGFAVSIVLVRMAQDISIQVKTAATWIGVTLTALVLILSSGLTWPAVEATAVFGAVVLGITAIVIMTAATQYGVTHMPVQRSAVIMLFEIVAGAVSSQLLTDEVVLPREWIGGGLIVLGAYLAARIKHEI